MVEIAKKKLEPNEKLTTWILMLSFLFFVAWGIIAIITKNNDFIFDRFFSAGLIAAFYALYRISRIRLPVIITGLLVLGMHHVKLYGIYVHYVPFDRIMHFAAGFALALIAYEVLRKTNIPVPGLVILSVLVAAGLGSIMEIIEFIGYSFGGQGEGLLFFGKGDIGEWNNTAWDLINNLLGGIMGALAHLFYALGFER